MFVWSRFSRKEPEGAGFQAPGGQPGTRGQAVPAGPTGQLRRQLSENMQTLTFGAHRLATRGKSEGLKGIFKGPCPRKTRLTSGREGGNAAVLAGVRHAVLPAVLAAAACALPPFAARGRPASFSCFALRYFFFFRLDGRSDFAATFL